MFRTLCGDDFVPNVVFVTTNWQLVQEEVGTEREEALCKNNILWKALLNEGAQLARFQDSPGSALRIIEMFDYRIPTPLRIQREIVGMRPRVRPTSVDDQLSARDFVVL